MDELREEDQLLAQRLSGRRPAAGLASAEKPVIAGGGEAVEVTAGVYRLDEGTQDLIEASFRTASQINIYGVAPRPLIDAMQRTAEQVLGSGAKLPWRRITYVTPSSELVLATRGEVRQGSVVQRWQSGLAGIRNCVTGVIDEQAAIGEPDPVELAMLETRDLFLGFVLVLWSGPRERGLLWASVGPARARDETHCLFLDQRADTFRSMVQEVDRLAQSSTPFVERQVEVSPVGLDDACGTIPPGQTPHLQVVSLKPLGSTYDPPTCIPVAVTVLRSAVRGSPVALLKRRTRFNDADDFGKLSLLSSRLREEELAWALKVPLFTHLPSDAAIDAMWRGYGGRMEPISVPLEAFTRAAQVDVFVTCGLDLTERRLVHRGWQLVEREEEGCYLLFCVFELVLRRHPDPDQDELLLAKTWNEELIEIREDRLYTNEYVPELNRLLVRRQEWLRANVFAESPQPVEDAAEQPAQRPPPPS